RRGAGRRRGASWRVSSGGGGEASEPFGAGGERQVEARVVGGAGLEERLARPAIGGEHRPEGRDAEREAPERAVVVDAGEEPVLVAPLALQVAERRAVGADVGA